MKQQKTLWAGAMALTLGLAGIAGAQPGANNPGGGFGGPGGFGMTQEQRDLMARQQREFGWKMALTAAGFTDQKLQNDVVAYAEAQEKGREPLRLQSRKLNEALRNPDAKDTEIAALLNDWRALVDD